MIQLKNVTKVYNVRKNGHGFKGLFFPKYHDLFALININLEIKQGEFVSLLGSNGAGKTTLVKLICGLIQPTKGDIYINGGEVGENQHKVGLMLNSSIIYHRMTGYDNLEFFAKLYNIYDFDKRIKELSSFFEMKPWIGDLVENYSAGMKTKLAIARAIIHDPEILLLDEPTIGLDIRSSEEVRNKIKILKKTTVLCTHNLANAKSLSDRLILLNKGSIVKEATPDEDIKKHFMVEKFL